MSGTTIAFVPSTVAAPQFQATLDGSVYTMTVKWNFFGQRYYLECDDLSGNLVFNQPLIGSPNPQPLESLSNVLGAVTAETSSPHAIPVGSLATVTVSGASPSDYNGVFEAVAASPTVLTYSLASGSGVVGPATVPGSFGPTVDMAFGYFQTSTLVYYDAASQFVVTP